MGMTGNDAFGRFQAGAYNGAFNWGLDEGLDVLKQLVPRYGNFGGPGWTAGNGPTPEDDMDALFATHDDAYANKDFKNGDRTLINGLTNLPLNYNNWTSPPSNLLHSYVYRCGALAVFIPKYQISWGHPIGGYGTAKIGF